jgi:DNA polymerase III subunit epsilon
MYAVVDIETTGGNASDNRIIEVAVVIHDGKKVVEEYETLVNPGMPIPRFISALTGITGEMVADAPDFTAVAPRLHELLHDKIFVAHNVNFDYTFIRREFAEAGIDFNRKRLCTIRLSRKLLPGKASYSLGKLCREVGISLHDHHRAGGDARATARLLDLLLASDREGFIDYSVKKSSSELSLPPHLPRKDFDTLPRRTGVYYFHNAKGKIIYIGKAVNLKQRVASHFALNSESRGKGFLMSEIHSISYQESGSELVALLLESQEIKRHWPDYNFSQKGPLARYGVYEYRDQNNYLRLGILKKMKSYAPLAVFSSIPDARDFITGMVKSHDLCPRLAGLQQLFGACMGHESGECRGACAQQEAAELYNLRHREAALSLRSDQETFVITEKGRNGGERSIVLVENGAYQGWGFIRRNVPLDDLDLLKSYIHPSPETESTRAIINAYLRSPSAQVVRFTESSGNNVFKSTVDTGLFSVS